MSYVNGLHGAAGKAARQAAADAQAQADAAAAAAHAAMRAAKPKNQPVAQAGDSPAPTDPVASVLGFDVPKKIAGIPTWMLMAGGLMTVMFVFGGKRR